MIAKEKKNYSLKNYWESLSTTVQSIAGVVTALVTIAGGIATLHQFIPVQDWFNSGSNSINNVSTIHKERIQFSKGNSSHDFSVNLRKNEPRAYLLRISKYQHVHVSATNALNISVYDDDNIKLSPIKSSDNHIEVVIPETGDYTLLLTGKGDNDVKIVIPPL